MSAYQCCGSYDDHDPDCPAMNYRYAAKELELALQENVALKAEVAWCERIYNNEASRAVTAENELKVAMERLRAADAGFAALSGRVCGCSEACDCSRAKAARYRILIRPEAGWAWE